MKKDDVEWAVAKLKVLLELLIEINAGAQPNTWRESNDRIWVLTDAMEPLVDGLCEYIEGGGEV